MPFPLAHPAAVLPLRRLCPRWFCLPALFIGSLTPDAGYVFGEYTGGALSHQPLGSITFCLPLGLLLVMLFYVLRSPAVRTLPAPYQRALLPSCQQAPASVWVVVISLLIGTWSHQLWDSFTHNEGWGVQHLPVLKTAVFTWHGRTARVCRLLWYGCSFAGVIWLFFAFEKWKQTRVYVGAHVSTREVLRDAVLVALMVLPIALVHHLVRGHKSGLYLLAALCALPALGITFKVRKARKGAAVPKS
jgi:hypothetical protein